MESDHNELGWFYWCDNMLQNVLATFSSYGKVSPTSWIGIPHQLSSLKLLKNTVWERKEKTSWLINKCRCGPF